MAQQNEFQHGSLPGWEDRHVQMEVCFLFQESGRPALGLTSCPICWGKGFCWVLDLGFQAFSLGTPVASVSGTQHLNGIEVPDAAIP